MKRITIDLPDEIYRELKIRCATGGITMSNVVRELLEKILTGRSMDRNFMETMRKIESENNEIKDVIKEKEESRRKFFAGLKKSGKKP
jgi:plasmid stability protein